MKKRARDYGIPFEGTPGKYNAITDVEGVEVGYHTVIYGEPEDYKGPGSDFARTGVTAILPRGKKRSACFSGTFSLNGNGELTGTHWIEDSGFMHGPMMITNTNSVGTVRDTTIGWMLENKFYYPHMSEGEEMENCGFFYPPVGETWDGILNDTNGFHVTAEHTRKALDSAKGGAIEEGNVGGGTGMICHEFKGGTGTASRKVTLDNGKEYTVGILVQSNHGGRDALEIKGVRVGEQLKTNVKEVNMKEPKPGTGSIIVVLATDAPVLPWQIKKLCKRIPIGIGKLGGGNANSSGDIFLGFSTANENAYTRTTTEVELLGDEIINPLYVATVEATEEAILNSMCAAETMYGRNNNVLYELPMDEVVEIMNKHNMINK